MAPSLQTFRVPDNREGWVKLDVILLVLEGVLQNRFPSTAKPLPCGSNDTGKLANGCAQLFSGSFSFIACLPEN